MARPSVPEAVRDNSSVARAGRSIALLLLLSLRPGQWIKNLFVFAALIFSRHLFDGAAIARTAATFVVFCALSGAVYLFNDVADREADQHHPEKARRPIASGALAPRTALAAGALLTIAALAAAWALRPQLGIVAFAYAALLGLYSMRLKHVVILDVLLIAVGFVLRAIAGGVVIDVAISQWLLLCTTLLALFLALAKRRHELLMLAAGAPGHRRALEHYTPYLLDQMVSVVTASTLIAYAFYAISAETAQKFGTDRLGLTIPFPLYGIFRYLYLVHREEGGGSPSELLLKDRPLLLCVALWVVAVVLIVYTPLGR